MSSLVSLIDELASSLIESQAESGYFADVKGTHQLCCELLSQFEEYQFPVLTPNISALSRARWSVYWEVCVLPKSITISLINCEIDIVSLTYKV